MHMIFDPPYLFFLIAFLYIVIGVIISAVIRNDRLIDVILTMVLWPLLIVLIPVVMIVALMAWCVHKLYFASEIRLRRLKR